VAQVVACLPNKYEAEFKPQYQQKQKIKKKKINVNSGISRNLFLGLGGAGRHKKW
jgi:hypothetical protein